MISTSKIKNSRAIMKNWRENGVLGGFMAVSPHSNWVQGVFVCFVIFFVFCRINMNRRVSNVEIDQMMEIFIIFLAF